MNHIIILDLDGVLITTFPVWKPDEMDDDGYSKFNPVCLNHFRSLLAAYPSLRIVISSSRRVGKTVERLEEIFAFRGINNKIIGKIPDPVEYYSREVEVSDFIKQQDVQQYLIIDDDVSLRDISAPYADKLILTNYREGFSEDCLKKAHTIIEGWGLLAG